MDDELLGRVIGDRFMITGVLGDGGMGTVYRGTDIEAGRDVAIKLLHDRAAEDPVIRARFTREAQLGAHIDHPNAVRILDSGMDDDIPYLVMELVEGRDLFDVLVQCGRLPEARAVSILLQICDAVAMAHDRGILHRDLKPENVRLTGAPSDPEGERVKLLDFGVAKWLGPVRSREGAAITLSGSIVGTPAYMAPEQCSGGVLDARTDVYACGALLYHLITGKPVFDDESPLVILFRHVHEPPVAPSKIVPTIDRSLEAIILKALAKRPEDRHQSAHELWEDLLDVLPRLEAKETRAARARVARLEVVIGPESPWATAHRRPPPRRALPRWIPVAVGGLAAAGALLWFSGIMDRPSPHMTPPATVTNAQTGILDR